MLADGGHFILKDKIQGIESRIRKQNYKINNGNSSSILKILRHNKDEHWTK